MDVGCIVPNENNISPVRVTPQAESKAQTGIARTGRNFQEEESAKGS
jgi:hypothetical protein